MATGHRTQRNWSADENTQFRRMWLAGDSARIMAVEFRTSIGTILRHKKMLGLPDRPSPIIRDVESKKAKPLKRGAPTLPPLRSVR